MDGLLVQMHNRYKTHNRYDTGTFGRRSLFRLGNRITTFEFVSRLLQIKKLSFIKPNDVLNLKQPIFNLSTIPIKCNQNYCISRPILTRIDNINKVYQNLITYPIITVCTIKITATPPPSQFYLAINFLDKTKPKLQSILIIVDMILRNPKFLFNFVSGN